MDKMLRSLGLAYAFIVGRALAFPRAGLAPTQPGVLDLAIEGRSPIPTALADAANPLKLFRREETRTCGYIDGDYGETGPFFATRCRIFLMLCR